VCARVVGARVLARQLSRKEVLVQTLARKQEPARMPSQWPACWLVRGASRLQRPVRKPVGEVAQFPRRVREPVGEMARTQSRVRELALALEAQKPRRRLAVGRRAPDRSLARKFVPARRLLPNVM
jgi:hypothetical protein